MKIKKLSEIAKIDISGVDKKTNPGEKPVKLCNFTDVYYNWSVSNSDVPNFMDASAKDTEIERFSLKKGYVAITKDSETRDDIGISCLITENLENTILGYHCALIIPNEEIVDGGYLNACLQTKMSRTYFSNQASGSGQRYTLSVNGIGSVKVPIIPLEEQKKIANLLDSIDRKIRVNNKINDNLQQMVYQTYMHMFFGKKPNGLFKDFLVENEKSRIPVGDAKGKQGMYPFFTSGETINEWQNYLVEGINCFLSTGGNASIKVYDGKASYSTDTWCITGKGKYSAYLYFYLKSIIKSIDTSFFAGSGLKHLQKDALLGVDLYIPKDDEIDDFNKVVEPILNKSSHIYIESKKLVKQRDFLLPLLMNGQATIED
jgi:type I restriction enzyme S subunit